MLSVFYTSVSLREAEENRRKEHEAAIRIQSWFRACKVRAYLRYNLLCVCLSVCVFVRSKSVSRKKNDFCDTFNCLWQEKNMDLNNLCSNFRPAFFFAFRGAKTFKS